MLLARSQLQSPDGAVSINGLDVAIRALAMAVIVLLHIGGMSNTGASLNTSNWIVAALLVYNALVVIVIGVPFQRAPGFPLFLLDWLAGSVAVALTGGFFSPFIVLYYALAISAALRLGLYKSLLLVGGCALVFIVIAGLTPELRVGVGMPIVVVEVTSLLMVVVTTVSMRRATEIEAHRLRLEEQAAAQLRLLSGYTQRVLSEAQDLSAALQAVAAAAGSCIPSSSSLVVLTFEDDTDKPGREPLIATHGGPVPPRLGPRESRLLADGRPTWDTDAGSRSDTLAFAPLMVGHVVSGGLFIYLDRQQRFEESDLNLLINLGSHMGLAVRVARRYEEERERAIRSEESERLERDLLSVVSHELRTPLTAIKTGVSTLTSRAPARSIAQGTQDTLELEQRLLLNVERSTDRLITLVDELLDMARLRARRTTLNIQPLNMGDLITELAAQAHPILDERSQTLDLDLPPHGTSRWGDLVVMGDRRRLEQVILNLLSNANKYAPQGSKIVLGCTARQRTVRVFVRDEGPGVPLEEQTAIFDKFYQGDAAESVRDNRVRGVGLGLAIARAIVEMHGGSIGVSPGAKRGSTFYFALPQGTCPSLDVKAVGEGRLL